MATSKASSAVHDDRSDVPRADIPAHTVLSASRGVGSPSEGLSGRPAMADSCAGLVETSVWQSPSGATASMVVTFGEDLPRTILGTSERNLGEMQLRASNTTPTNGDTRSTLWRDYIAPWTRWLEESKYRAKATRDSYEWHVTAVLSQVGKPDLRDIKHRDVQDALGALKAKNGSWKPNTRNVYVASMRSFYAYVIDKEDLDELGVKDVGRKLDPVPLEQVEREKVQHDPPTRDEVQAIVDRAEASRDLDFAL